MQQEAPGTASSQHRENCPFIFVLPLLVILFMIYFGASTLKLKWWRQEKRPWMNLALGVLMISLGTFLIVYYQRG